MGKVKKGIEVSSNSSNHIYVNHDSKISGLSKFSVSLWCKPYSHTDSEKTGLIISKQYDGSLEEWSIGINSSSFDVYYKDTNENDFDPSFSYNFNIDEFYHIGFLFNDGELTLYVNGNYVNKITKNSNGMNSVQTKMIFGKNGDGAYSSGWLFDGIIDDIRLYNRVLSESEVKTIYEKTK